MRAVGKREGPAQVAVDKNGGKLLQLAELYYVIKKGRIHGTEIPAPCWSGPISFTST